MANARASPTARHTREVLPFALLVYREAAADVWTARSVLTGHVAHGPSAEAAVTALQTVLDVSILVATQHGQSPPDWFRRQRPDADRHAVEFCRLVVEGVAEQRRSAVARAGCALEMRIATRVA